MHIYINSKLQEIPATATVTEVLQLLDITALQGTAIAVNNNIISRQDWDAHALQPDDRLTLIRAAQGG
ncbi:sulfur carrier protein ThiS [Chitinophagaceae bacterium MMS25-I14]